MIEFKRESQILTCIPDKDIIASNIPLMRNKLNSFLAEDPSWEELVFDCGRIKVLDSIGVNLIVNLFKEANKTKKKFKMVGCNDAILNVMKLFRMNEHFTMEPA